MTIKLRYCVFGSLFLFALVFLAGCGRNEPEATVAPTTVANFPLKDYEAKANAAYVARADVAKAREAANIMAQAHKSAPQDYEAAWLLAKYSYFLGAHVTDNGERKDAFNQGIKAGEDAVALDANKPDGHFWLGANLGGRAQINMLDGASDAGTIKDHMQMVIKLDPGYQNGSAYMALGQVYLEMPRMAGGDPQEAVKQMEAGLKYGGDNAMFRLRLAQAYYAVDRKDEAKKQLEMIASMKPDPNYLPEQADALKEANEMLSTKF